MTDDLLARFGLAFVWGLLLGLLLGAVLTWWLT
jgi:hypothetical protein